MRPEVYWIDEPAGARLAIIPRPRAGDWLDGEIAGWRGQGIDVIVSLLEAGEVRELGLRREAGVCHNLGMEFISFPFPDGGVPATRREATALAEGIVMRLSEGKAVALHCRAGIGRSSLEAACVLVLLGMAPGTAFHLIGRREVSRSQTPNDKESGSIDLVNQCQLAASSRPEICLECQQTRSQDFGCGRPAEGAIAQSSGQ